MLRIVAAGVTALFLTASPLAYAETPSGGATLSASQRSIFPPLGRTRVVPSGHANVVFRQARLRSICGIKTCWKDYGPQVG
jgi:hypothetical protein